MENKKKHSFQTETKKMLDIMIHSIYTHKEIFLRELISNASDALNKKRFESLSNKEMDSDQELMINISIDEDERTLTVEDNGIGMSETEVIENIGTVARSGSENFVKALEEKDDALEIINGVDINIDPQITNPASRFQIIYSSFLNYVNVWIFQCLFR